MWECSTGCKHNEFKPFLQSEFTFVALALCGTLCGQLVSWKSFMQKICLYFICRDGRRQKADSRVTLHLGGGRPPNRVDSLIQGGMYDLSLCRSCSFMDLKESWLILEHVNILRSISITWWSLHFSSFLGFLSCDLRYYYLFRKFPAVNNFDFYFYTQPLKATSRHL